MLSNAFVQKIIRKLSYIGCKVIPNHTSLRPTGYYPTILGKAGLAEAETVQYTEVIKGYTSDLNLEDPFYALCTEGLSPQVIAWVPPCFIVQIPRGRLQQNVLGTSIAIISPLNKLIGEISYQFYRTNVEVPIDAFDIFSQRYFSKPVRYKGVVFSMLSGSVASSNYFHWLYDTLPRLYILKESGLFSKVDYFLVPRLQHKYHRETLAALGVKEQQIIECGRYTHIEADNLIVSSPVRHRGQIPSWVCTYHHKFFVDRMKNDEQTYPSYIYIRRGDSKIRQIVNEEQLMKLLEGFGFTSLLLSELPHEQQVALFSSAKVIVSAHGAGLANLSYCKKGTTVVELFASHYIKPTYQVISKRMGLNYKYIICKVPSGKKPKTTKQAIDTNLIADLPQIRKVLSNILPVKSSRIINVEEI